MREKKILVNLEQKGSILYDYGSTIPLWQILIRKERFEKCDIVKERLIDGSYEKCNLYDRL